MYLPLSKLLNPNFQQLPGDVLLRKMRGSGGNETSGLDTYLTRPDRLVNYDPTLLTSPRILFELRHSIITSSAVWHNMTLVIAVIFLFATISLFASRNSKEPIHFEKLDEFVQHLKAFIAFMLGMHVSQSCGRFHQLITNMNDLFDLILQIQAQLLIFDVPEKERETIARYSILSCWFYYYELAEIHCDPCIYT